MSSGVRWGSVPHSATFLSCVPLGRSPSVSLHFLVCKMGMTVPVSHGCGQDSRGVRPARDDAFPSEPHPAACLVGSGGQLGLLLLVRGVVILQPWSRAGPGREKSFSSLSSFLSLRNTTEALMGVLII